MTGAVARITKRVVDSATPRDVRYFLWDGELRGFGLRIEASGTKVYVLRYRPKGTGRSGPKRFVTIGRHGPLTPEAARERAKVLLGSVSAGSDPALARTERKAAPTLAELADRFLEEHVRPKRKRTTFLSYQGVVHNHLKPALGARKAMDVKRADLARLHTSLLDRPFMANRVLAVAAAMFNWGEAAGLVSEGTNPVVKVERYSEGRRERFLSTAELQRLGATLREAETVGLPWKVDERKQTAKHAPKEENRRTVLDPHAVAALRLLLFVGARLREMLHLEWSHVDFERGLLFLPDSKTGKKTIILNAPALAILSGLPPIGRFVIAGTVPERPRSDLKRPWEAVRARAKLDGMRLHDLRHSYASVGAGAGLGLPIIGKLLGHVQASTTSRYAHLDADPLRRASESIAATIAASMGEAGESVTTFPSRRAR